MNAKTKWLLRSSLGVTGGILASLVIVALLNEALGFRQNPSVVAMLSGVIGALAIAAECKNARSN